MSEKSAQTLNQIFLEIESLVKDEPDLGGETTSLTLWVIKGYKEKFDELQDRTDKRFGKILKDLVYLAIDKAYDK